MDPSLSRTVFHLVEGEGEKTIGVPGKSDISLRGISILDPHGKIISKGGKFSIEASGNAKIMKNGKKVMEPTAITHLDRYII